ncbi:MAG: hypothetical protein EZS28_005886 [Streblomastix strix]|uniref:Uncharacterized protein n=1 Tax=Streblomastix strix TaxID=222440 RepID=A0A5J4WUK7_9EUKA|nr:MAG: hypothetical protein EZS28_005886 [Streblomastix strix]
MRSTKQKDEDISKIVYPFRQEQRERLDLIDCFVREWCENEEIDKNVFFLMKLNRLLGESKSPEFSKAMANVLGRYPEIVAKLTEMAFDGYALALQVFLFLVDSENVVKMMIEHKLIQFLIELTEKSDHPFIPILCLQILGGIGRLPEFVRYISTDECVECSIACVDLTVPCCKRDAMSEKYPVYQEDVFSSFTASQSIPVSTSISNMVPTPLTDSNTPSSSINQLPQSTYASSTQQTVGKTGGKDQMNFPNQNSYTPNLLLNVGQNQNSTFKPLDLPAVAQIWNRSSPSVC